MTNYKKFDAIIIGGSYAGLAAGMALGRALKQVLIIDSGKPCNRQTPHSHNFLTQDGTPPAEIAMLGKKQVQVYPTVTFCSGLATYGRQTVNGFEMQIESGETFLADKLIFATGIKDMMADIAGYDECWGISVLHCPYCHGYEVKQEKTGILGNGEYGYGLCWLILNWTNDLTLFTNGPSTLTKEQTVKLQKHHINIVEDEVQRLEHSNGYIQNILFKNNTKSPLKAIYTRSPFEQHFQIPETLGCKLTDEGYIQVDALGETSVPGIFACGDNATRMRTVANAVAMGTMVGMTVSKKMIFAAF